MYCTGVCGGYINQGYFTLLDCPLSEAVVHIETTQEFRSLLNAERGKESQQENTVDLSTTRWED